MSWITFIWSLTVGIRLTLGAVHFLVWTRRRDEWANLGFSITTVAVAGYAVLDMIALRGQTPAEYGHLWRWTLSLGMLEGVSIAWFIHLYLRAGRPMPLTFQGGFGQFLAGRRARAKDNAKGDTPVKTPADSITPRIKL